MEAQLSLDRGDTFADVELTVTGRHVDGASLLGLLFTTDAAIAEYVDTMQELCLLVPDVSDDPLVGVLRRQGADYLLVVNPS